MRMGRCVRTCYSRGILYKEGTDYIVDESRPFFARYFEFKEDGEEPVQKPAGRPRKK